MRAYRFNSPLQADFDKYYNDNLRMYVNELAFCISYCKANGDVELVLILNIARKSGLFHTFENNLKHNEAIP